MFFIPYKKLTTHSEISEDVLFARLNENVEPHTGFRFDNYSKSLKPFVGKIREKTFDIRPIFKGRNSFIPYIHGSIEKQDTGNIIIVTMRLHYATVFFVVILFVILPIYLSFKYHEIGGIVFALLAYFMTIFGFNYEYNKAKRTLENILKATVNT
jgi:hypothetical protein